MESTLATIRHHTDRAKGYVTRDTMLAFPYKLAMCAELRWKQIRSFCRLGQGVQGVKFQDGIAVDTSAEVAA